MIEFHEVANIFPMMNDEEFSALVIDIKENGLREPIWTYQGKIIDGRNRYRACRVADVEPQFREWNGEGSLIAFVVSLNLNRRHLTSSQKAMIAVEVEKHLAEETKIGRPGKDGNISVISGEARSIAARIVGTNDHYVTDAKKIIAQAPELKEVVLDGSISIPDAKAIARLPEDQREEVLEQLFLADSTDREKTRASREARNAVYEAQKSARARRREIEYAEQLRREQTPEGQADKEKREQERLRKWEEDKQLRIARDDAHIARVKEQLNAPETASARSNLYEAAREAAPLLVQGLRAYLRFLVRFDELMGMVKVTEEQQISEKHTYHAHPREWPNSMYRYEGRAEWIRKMVDEAYNGSYEDFLVQVDEIEQFYEETRIPSINLAELQQWIEDPSHKGNGGDEDD